MPYASLFSVLFSAVCVISLVTGIFVLQNNRKTNIGWCFFALAAAVFFWSAGLAFATSAPDAATCELWRRFSALGWGTVYSIILHFILIITGRESLLRKWWFYIILYLPASITVFAFAIPSGLNPIPYYLHLTKFGWVNVAENNIWDWVFYVYYIGYIITALVLVQRWGQKSPDKNIKMQSRIIFLSFVATLVLATITDVILNTKSARLPQMAPILMLIPFASIYYTIKKYGFIVSAPTENKGKYASIIISVIVYIVFSFMLNRIAVGDIPKVLSNFDPSSTRGIIVQLQMFMAVYLVIREGKPGYIAALLLIIYSLISTLVFMIRSGSVIPLPGIITYIGILLIILLIIGYKKNMAVHIKKIEDQRRYLEASEKKLYHLAFYDPLTGLPNRELFVNRLEQAIHAAQRNATMIGVMFIDLDSFKSVNDTMGHTTGDLVLKQMADRLSSCLRKEDTISRFGGDEFLIQIVNIKKVKDLYTIANKILDLFKKAITVENNEFFISPTVGVSVYPVDGEDTETLIKNADIAMYSAKKSGKNQCAFCSLDMKNDIIKNLKLTNSMYRALDKNELYLEYQPLIKTDTQAIAGFEALLRWNHPQYGMVSPGVFIPMAEKTGMIKPIGLWVLKTACEQYNGFRNSFGDDITMSVNLSVEQLRDYDIAGKISRILDETKTDAQKVQIEITESVAFNEDPYILHRVKQIKDLGVSIAIDDFGTGHSSLSRLKTFPIDMLKIDMEFVRGISSKSRKDRAIIESIIQIAKNLGIEVLAEGVETEEQYLYLRGNQCDKIQGYYFYKPMPADEIESVLKGMKQGQGDGYPVPDVSGI